MIAHCYTNQDTPCSRMYFVYGIDTASIIKNMNITKMIQQAI